MGRFSHLESMTFNVLRDPRPPSDPRTRQPKPWGTTRNLMDGVAPFGMLKLDFSRE
jgi:hypothetical protein